MENQDDLHSLNLVLQGDVSAFRKIVERYEGNSYRLAVRMMKNREDAEDVVQDAFIKAYKALDKFTASSAFSTWLYRIVYNLCIDRIRKQRVQLVEINDAEGTALDEVDAHNGANDQVKYLAQAMKKLSNEESAMINMYYEEGLDMKEIGVIMKMSHQAARKKISRIREKLKNELKKMLGEEIMELL